MEIKGLNQKEVDMIVADTIDRRKKELENCEHFKNHCIANYVPKKILPTDDEIESLQKLSATKSRKDRMYLKGMICTIEWLRGMFNIVEES